MGMGGQGLDASEKLGRQVVDLEAEKILDLGEKDDDRNPVGEADDHGHRDESDQLPHASQAHGEQEDAGQHGGAEQVVETVDGDDAVNDGNESAGRAADLYAGAAQGGGDEAGDNGRPDARSRRAARRDGESHGQRQRQNTDRDARGEVFAELCAVIARQAIE